MIALRSAVRFTEELHLAAPLASLATAATPARAPLLVDGAEGAAVVGGSVVSFVAGLSAREQQDVLDGLLLAQLAADAQFARVKNPMKWYAVYFEVLGKIGWVMQEAKFSSFKASTTNFTLAQALAASLAAVLSANEKAILEKALAALQGLASGDGTITLFDNSSATQEGGVFQVGVASSEGGAIALSLGAFQYKAKTSKTKVLFISHARTEMKLKKASQVITLNAERYAALRDMVKEKLMDAQTRFVAGLQI